jgi:hypothetical protein
MAEPLADVESELNAATVRARQLVDSTEPRLFTVRPHLSAWSAAECIAHLNMSTEQFLPVLRAALEDAREKGWTAKRTPRMDLLGAVLRWFLEPPVRAKLKTAAPFVPRGVRAKAESIAEFTRLQDRVLEMIREARDLDLRRVKIVSPFDKRVKYNVYSAFRILIAHQRRHLWQAEQAVETLRKIRATAA